MGFFKREKKFICPMQGKIISITDVPDDVFRNRLLGDGFAIELNGNEVVSPIDGEITTVFPTGHAFGIKAGDMELLIHIGLDTVKLEGKPFDIKVKDGQKVKAGDILTLVDTEYVKANNTSLVSPVIFTSGEKIEVKNLNSYVNVGDKNIIKF
ncbi:MAG: PTS glucose transporter subunit IIA [Clostridium sp.]|nr:PTS glucose transporter subunit IIA [Clostridium sp.]